MKLNLTPRYLAGKDYNVIDESVSLVLQELLNDISSDATGPNDCEVCVSRHELSRLVFTVCVISDSIRISSPSIYPLSERLSWQDRQVLMEPL